MSPLVEVIHLRKHFGAVVAVDDISFSVPRGEVLGFLGPNGAGKSTTMKLIVGLLTPSFGTAVVAGRDVCKEPIEAKRMMGYLPEGSPLYGDMTPEGFLNFVGRTRLMAPAVRRHAVADVMARLGLDEMRHRRIETLSKGYRRRVGLAQAILHDPDVLILDEPTDGLDPNQKHDVRELIRSMGNTKAIIVSTHILEEVDAVCDRAIIIGKGRSLVDETPSELYARCEDRNAILLKVTEAEAPRAAALLRELPEIAAVESAAEEDGFVLLTARPTGGRFIADAVGRTLRETNIVPTELRGAITRLDDVFRSITQGG